MIFTDSILASTLIADPTRGPLNDIIIVVGRSTWGKGSYITEPCCVHDLRAVSCLEMHVHVQRHNDIR